MAEGRVKHINIKSYFLLLIACLLLSQSIYPKDKIPVFQASDINGNQISISRYKEKVLMVLFFDPSRSDHKMKMTYAQVLYNKFKDRGFGIIGVASEGKDLVEKLQIKGKITFALIFDENKKIHKLFQLAGNTGGTILANRKGKIVFHTAQILEIENLRQIVEKEVTGKITYDFSRPAQPIQFRIKNKIHEILLQDLRTDSIQLIDNFKDDYLIITFFSFLCPLCKSGRRVETLKNLEKRIQEKGAEGRVILVFFDPFDNTDIEEWKKFFPVSLDIYLTEDLLTEDEKYITDESLKIDPFTVVLDKKKEIKFVEGQGIWKQDIAERIMEIILKKRL
jgi:peroxiredoxin